MLKFQGKKEKVYVMHSYVINTMTFYQMGTRILRNFNIQSGRIVQNPHVLFNSSQNM